MLPQRYLHRLSAASGLIAFFVCSPLGADGVVSRRHADALRDKVAAITAFDAERAGAPRRIVVTESELNSYLALDAGADLPPGVVEPSIAILGAGRLTARALVDLDAVRNQSPPNGLFDPRNLLTGRLPVAATGRLETAGGQGRLAVESASVGGVPVPMRLLQEVVAYYSRTPEIPAGISLDDPFDLPAHIREIHLERGQATIVQ